MSKMERAAATIVLPPGSTGDDLQNAFDTAVFGDVIVISGDMPFTGTVTLRSALEVYLQSDEGNNHVLYQFTPGARHFQTSGSLILQNITLDGRGIGGGIQEELGNCSMLDGTIIQNCTAQNGGGVEVVRGLFNIYGGEIRNCTAQNGGGVFQDYGTFYMSGYGVVHDNKAALCGGGLYIKGDFILSGGTVSLNESANGGGLYINSGSTRFSRGLVDKNKAVINGGGIYLAALASMAVSGPSFLTGNTAAYGGGGGIYVYSENGTYSNLTTAETVVFSCNLSAAPYSPPDNADILYPDIKAAETTIMQHPLNNNDIFCVLGEPVPDTHNVVYESNGGTGSHTGPDVRPCGTDTVLSADDIGIMRSRHTFTGWNTEPDGSGISYVPGDEIAPVEDTTLYAQWEADGRPCPEECYRISKRICCKICCDMCCPGSCSCFCSEFSKRFSRAFCREFCRPAR